MKRSIKYLLGLCLRFGALALLAACGATEVLPDLLNASIPTDGYKVIKDVVYAARDRGKLDIYVPEHLAPGRPVAVFYYGGSWQGGDKNDYLFVGQALASKGIIAVIADYRVYPQVYFPTFMDDTAEAMVWTHLHIHEYGGDPDNVFAVGHSAGAFNAVMLTLNQSYMTSAHGDVAWIRGTISLAGPFDFLPLHDDKLVALFSMSKPAATQPITFARAGAPPMLLLTGNADDQVSPVNSYHLASKLKAYGDEVEVKTYQNIGHIGIVLSLANGFRDRAPTLDDISVFIQSHLAEKH